MIPALHWQCNPPLPIDAMPAPKPIAWHEGTMDGIHTYTDYDLIGGRGRHNFQAADCDQKRPAISQQ